MDEDGAASLRTAGELVLRSMILTSLGWSLVASDRLERAADVLEEALGIVTTMQNRDGIARTLDALAAVSLHRREPRPSALLFGAAQGVRRSVGGRVWVIDLASVGTLEAELRRALGADAFERAFEEGVALPTERAIELARAAVASCAAERHVSPNGPGVAPSWNSSPASTTVVSGSTLPPT